MHLTGSAAVKLLYNNVQSKLNAYLTYIPNSKLLLRNNRH